MPAKSNLDCIVVGGGISGLVCAHRLRQAGVEAGLLEQSSRLGGMIETVRQDGFQFECGPQSFLLTDDALDVVRSLGIEGRLQLADPKAPRFVVHRGALCPVPMSPPALFATPLLSRATKLRLLAEPFRRAVPPDGDESVASFIRRKFGEDLLQNLVGPFVSGVHAGDPEKLSVASAFPFLAEWERQHGSVIRGAMRSRPAKGARRAGLASFGGGLSDLVKALSYALGDAATVDASVTRIAARRANGGRFFDVNVSFAGRTQTTLAARSVVVATDAGACATVLGSLAPQLKTVAAALTYAPVAVVAAGYRREQVTASVNGFGFLVPRTEAIRSLGTIFTSALFPNRAPEGTVSLATFLGGATDPDVTRCDEAELAETAERDNARILGITGGPRTRFVRVLPRALPQYNLGHAAQVAEINRELAAIPGLFLAGNYLSGASIGACCTQAGRTAEAVCAYLRSGPP